MNFRRWIVVGFVIGLAAFSFYHLSTAGSDYQDLTTSDSGFFYGIARNINEEDGLIEEYELSHPPQGNSVQKKHQLQPLMLVTFYRGLHSVDSSVSLLEASRYFSPFIFALAIIGIFLAGRELGGNLTGGASAIFMSTMVGSIYWTKIGAFDREISLIFFGSWILYLLVKLFRSPRQDLLKYGIFSGLVYGLFLITWPGALFIAPIIVGPLLLILLERTMKGLGIFLTGCFSTWLGVSFSQGGMIFLLLGTAAILLGLARIATDIDALSKLEKRIFHSARSHIYLIVGVAGTFAVATLVAVQMGGYGLNIWNSFAERVFGFLGVSGGGGGGLGTPQIATEMPPPSNYLKDLSNQLYRSSLLFNITTFLAAAGLLKALWTRKKHELLLLMWLIVPAAMATSQARFFRVFWPMWPVVSAYGVYALVWMGRRLLSSPALVGSGWLDKFKHPLIIAIVGIAFVVPFFQNARANATETSPTPHGGTHPSVYHSLVDSYYWLRENTPKDSVVAVEWSYGHLCTGLSGHPSVTDGAQSTGIWENREQPPPDYVQDDVNNDGKITEADDRDGDGKWEMTGEGRRPTMQKFYSTSDENWLEGVLASYRDNYNLKIDYIVFNLGRVRSALLSLFNQNAPSTSSVSQSGANYIFDFGEENIILNTSTNRAYTQEGESLGGVIFYYLQNDFFSYAFEPNPAYEKNLWVMIGQEGQITGVLTDFEGIPMVIRIRGGYEMPTFLQKAYSSPHNYVDVYKVSYSPSPTSPESDEKINDNTPTLEWSEAVGRTKYQFALSRDASFSSFEILENVYSNSYTVPTSLTDGEYYWKVRTFVDDKPTDWSSTQHFIIDTVPPEIPTLSSPSNSSTLSDNTPSFQWSAVSGAESYGLQVDNDSDFGSPEIQTEVTGNSFSADALEENNYWWRVRSYDLVGNGSAWSENWSFSIQE